MKSVLSSGCVVTVAVCPQRPRRPLPRARRTSSCVLTADASARRCAATSSTTARTSAPTRSAARQVGSGKASVRRARVCQSAHTLPFARSDTKLTDCRSNRTHCGDGDEAHCVANGTDSFCSCKAGFQKTGHRTCGGTGAPEGPRGLASRRFTGGGGFRLCSDKEECLQFGLCSHICNNTKGSYKCSCHKHFTRISDTCKADSEERLLDSSSGSLNTRVRPPARNRASFPSRH